MPIDLIVYTKPMYERFVDLKSMFSREVLKRGIVLYEKVGTERFALRSLK